MALPRLVEISLYPIKSTAGIRLVEGRVTPRGLELDRHWMLVDEHGEAITAREHPPLVLVRPQLVQAGLRVTAPQMPELHIGDADAEEAPLAVRIWGEDCTAFGQGAQADGWFSRYLGRPCRLVHLSDAHPRALDPDYGRDGDTVSFADAFPLLLISLPSLADLNRRLPITACMRRFRPNLVVDGCAPYAEDGWSRLRIGEVVFEGTKGCTRCALTTVDPDTGIKHVDQEPLRTLATYRKRGNGVVFGRNLIPRSGGSVRVGDVVELLD